MKKFMRFTMVCCLVCLLSGAAVAQDVRKTLPGDLTLRQAQTVLAAALKKAEEIEVPVNIAVVDTGGNLKAFVRTASKSVTAGWLFSRAACC